MHIRKFAQEDAAAVVQLWQDAGLTRPWNDPFADIARKQDTQGDLFFVACEGNKVIGTAMTGYDGHRGWVHYLAVQDEQRHLGAGRALMSHAETALLALGCPKVQLQVRPDNLGVLAFYDRLGYSTYEAVNLGKRLVED